MEQLGWGILGQAADPSPPGWRGLGSGLASSKRLGECWTQLGILEESLEQLLEQDLGWLASWNGLEPGGRGQTLQMGPEMEPGEHERI